MPAKKTIIKKKDLDFIVRYVEKELVTGIIRKVIFPHDTCFTGSEVKIFGDLIVCGSSPGSGGEANLAANVGSGVGQVFRDKAGVTFNFKTLLAGSNINITDNADDITIAATSGGDLAASYIVVGNTSSLTNERALTEGIGLNFIDDGGDSTFTILVDDNEVPFLSGATFTGPILATIVSATLGFSGSHTRLLDGRSAFVGLGTVNITSTSNGQVFISGTGDGGGGAGNTLDEAYDEGGSGVGRSITVDTGAIQFQGSIGTNTFEVTGTTDMTGTLYVDGGASRAIEATGSVDVNGPFSATSKSFVIPHPSKPNGLLRHGSLEGPEHAVFVRGKCRGPIIKLPPYWKDLVDEKTITVELQPIGVQQDLLVISWDSTKVVVRNGNVMNNHIHFFYTVYAERKDIDKLEVES